MALTWRLPDRTQKDDKISYHDCQSPIRDSNRALMKKKLFYRDVDRFPNFVLHLAGYRRDHPWPCLVYCPKIDAEGSRQAHQFDVRATASGPRMEPGIVQVRSRSLSTQPWCDDDVLLLCSTERLTLET